MNKIWTEKGRSISNGKEVKRKKYLPKSEKQHVNLHCVRCHSGGSCSARWFLTRLTAKSHILYQTTCPLYQFIKRCQLKLREVFSASRNGFQRHFYTYSLVIKAIKPRMSRSLISWCAAAITLHVKITSYRANAAINWKNIETYKSQACQNARASTGYGNNSKAN